MKKINNVDVEDQKEIPVKTKMYWTKDTDEAIFEFIAETDDKIRSKIFEKRIHKPLVKLIDFMTFKLNIVKHGSPEQDIHALRASCFEKFFRITTPNSTYIRAESGRPFNFLTSVIRNHLIGYVEEIHKRKKKIEMQGFKIEDIPEEIYNKVDKETIELFRDYLRTCVYNGLHGFTLMRKRHLRL